MRGGRGGGHGYGTRIDDTCAGGDGDLRLWLLPDTEVERETQGRKTDLCSRSA